jgi:hypothetical protein
MSHETGKLEVLAVDEQHIYLRYHQAKDAELPGRIMVYQRNDEACWLDELVPVDGLGAPKFPPSSPFDIIDGPE